jgi:heme/copper-type cytochrome/quinol oxidase subunit 2
MWSTGGWSRVGLVACLAAGIAVPDMRAQSQDGSRREVTVTMTEAGFEPARIEVRLNELVQVTFVSPAEPHAFTLDAYRVSKRATPGRPSTFEFRADRVGSTPFYCALMSANGRTHDERGELVVRR